MSVSAVLAMLLCSWSLLLANGTAAMNDDVALADGDVAFNDDQAKFMDTLNSLERRVSDLATKLLLHEDMLTQQKTINQELTTRLFEQGRFIQQLRSASINRASATVSRDEAKDATGSTTTYSGLDSAVSGHKVTKRPYTAHNLVKRSDDDDPLLAVVNQISQQVTEQGAEIQALKAKTTADLNALKVQTTADVQTLQNSDRQQDVAIQDARSSLFVRWGRSTCSASSSLVYSGQVGGSQWTHSGAATNYLCLTPSPSQTGHAIPRTVAYLYGAEYNTHDSHQDRNAVCAVCRAAFSTTVMVPGTLSCSSGWHRQYWGYLMAGTYDHSSGSEYICVDSALESAPHGEGDEDGVQLGLTVTHCGSLPCGPYVNNKVVLCVVCSK